MTLALVWKLGPWAALAIAVGIIGWQQVYIEGEEGRRLAAVIEAKDKAKEVSDEILVKQAEAISKNQASKETYTEKIIHAPATPDDEACRRSQRMRLGNHGVRDQVRGALGETK